MPDARALYHQFMKGAVYFNREFSAGNKNPVVMRLLARFEREVVQPFDEACLALTPDERMALEDQI